MAKNFKFLEHTADVKFLAWGKTLEEAFTSCAAAISKILCKEKIKMKKIYAIKSYGQDNESLLYNFLEEILYLFDTENFILAKVKEIKIKDNKLTAKVIGDNVEKYEIKCYIKSPTYNDMLVKKEKDKWVIQAVVDV
jgi:SHS2 domain-containing protein